MGGSLWLPPSPPLREAHFPATRRLGAQGRPELWRLYTPSTAFRYCRNAYSIRDSKFVAESLSSARHSSPQTLPAGRFPNYAAAVMRGTAATALMFPISTSARRFRVSLAALSRKAPYGASPSRKLYCATISESAALASIFEFFASFSSSSLRMTSFTFGSARNAA